VTSLAGIGQDRAFVHVDGALMAPVMWFASDVDKSIVPRFDYQPFMSSLVFSTHQWPGIPDTGSVVIIKKSTLPPPAIGGVDYTNTDGGTGSRSGSVALAMAVWVFGYTDKYRRKEADRCIRMAADLAQMLQSSGVTGVFCNTFSITFVFPQPPKDFGFSLARERSQGHVVVMPGVTNKLVIAFALVYLIWWHSSGRRLPIVT
jgi:glutamate/tyrosine decarboxylase-like PLP-dependent enzyme